MKFFITLMGAATLAYLPTHLSSQPVTVSLVTEAEVYTNGYAQVYAQSEHTLKKGINTITLHISGRAIPLQTLTAEIQPSGRIVRISDPQMLECTEDDSCRYYTEQSNALKEKIMAKSLELEKLDAQEKILLENARVTNSSNLNLNLLRESIQFLQRQLSEVKDARSKTKNSLDELQKEYQNLQSQLNNRTQYLRENLRKIAILAEVKTDGLYKLNMSYVSTGIRWNRQQEVDISEADEKAYLKNMATVQSDFWETWRNVKLTLIDRGFELSNKPLDIRPLRASFQSPSVQLSEISNMRMRAAKEASPSMAREILALDDVVNLRTTREQAADGEVFILTGVYSLSALKPLQTELFTDTLAVSLHYVVVPYLTNKVQLLGIVHQRLEAISLTPSVIRLNGRPLGLGSTPTIYGSDSAAFQLGFIKDVTVQRKRENPYSSRSFFGNSQRDIYEYTIHIINRRSTPITLTVIDRVPKSSDSQIDIKFKKADSTQPDKNGILKWMIHLSAGAQERLSFSYEISYPKGRTIAFGDDFME